MYAFNHLKVKWSSGAPEAAGGVVEDLGLGRRQRDVFRAGHGDQDLLRQLGQRLSGQLLLQVVFGREVPQDACAKAETGSAANWRLGVAQ